ncbi:LysM peptidoglycan-binding domain-containing protein [Actinomadura sp. NBRC 104412]|uniref:LysM peptidoglycan-binding domain-containing protein n=1 Tax=Actinomadura sp. NBRC 104412 TaxID=3032203 RepID=UPI00255396FA|nr:LysM peptidoglycan-binding domain-containing protein [Actinomadura sp. NBRC 104412]
MTFWLTVGPGARAGGRDDTLARGAVPTDVVGFGETLWGVAERNDPGGDPRITVQRIADLNGLSGSIVHPGQRLRVPAR